MDHTGQQLGNYALVQLLGAGRFAEVYLGTHVYLKMHAAVKVLRIALTQGAMDDFLNEAQIIALLQHPHIIRVLDFGLDTTTRVPFLVMDYAPYGTLRDLHPFGNRVPLPAIVSYVKQLASALGYAHDAGLIHRDVKPENILLGRANDLLLSDFGIAAAAHTTASLETLDPLGTPTYMAPELFEGKPRTQSDQYALGVMVYEWLCGQAPFKGTPLHLMHQHVHDSPPPLLEQAPGVSPVLERVVMRALAKDPGQRFPSIQLFAQALEQACFPHHATAVVSGVGQAVPIEEPQEEETFSPHAGPSGQTQPQYFTVLDIGTTSVRAAIVAVYADGSVTLLGGGRQAQHAGDMASGVVTDLAKVIAHCNVALLQAEQAAGLIAPSVIMVTAGAFLHGEAITVLSERPHPAQLITPEELEALINQASQRLHDLIEEQLVAATGQPELEIRLTDLSVNAISVDGQQVTNPVGFRGQRLVLTLFGAFAPLTEMSALETVAAGLDLRLDTITAAPCALTGYLAERIEAIGGAILLDIGSATTKIALVRQNKLVEVRVMPLAGGFFTRTIALKESVSIPEADRLKQSYSLNKLGGARRERMQRILAPACKEWRERLTHVLEDMAKSLFLPPAIFLAGGSARVPEIRAQLGDPSLATPFSELPSISIAHSPRLPGLADPTGFLRDAQDVMVLALASTAAELGKELSLSEQLMDQVLRKHFPHL